MYLIKSIRFYGYANSVDVTNGIQVCGLQKGGVLSNSFGIDISVELEENVDFKDFSTSLGEYWCRLERVSDVKIADDGTTIQMTLKKEENPTFEGFLVFVRVPRMEKNELEDEVLSSQFKISTSAKLWHMRLVNQMAAVLTEGDWIEASGKKISVENEELVIRNM